VPAVVVRLSRSSWNDALNDTEKEKRQFVWRQLAAHALKFLSKENAGKASVDDSFVREIAFFFLWGVIATSSFFWGGD
jgi:hypothetical protein